MVLMRVMRDLLERHDMKLWQTAPEERKAKRTGWGHLYKRHGAARYPNLIRELNTITGITGEERVEALASNLGVTLLEAIEEFAIYLISVVTPLDDRFSILAQALAEHNLTIEHLRERLMRGGEKTSPADTTPLLLFRAISRRKIDKPVVREGEDAGAVWQEQDEISRALSRVRADLTRLLIARVEIDLRAQWMEVAWTPRMGEAMVRMGFAMVDMYLFRLDAEHLWIDLSGGEDS